MIPKTDEISQICLDYCKKRQWICYEGNEDLVKCGMEYMDNLPSAISILSETLKIDEDYYYGWQSNIAMSFYDEIKNSNIKIDHLKLHEICNNAARKFLTNLIYK